MLAPPPPPPDRNVVSLLYAKSYSGSVFFFPGILLFKFGKIDSIEGYDYI